MPPEPEQEQEDLTLMVSSPGDRVLTNQNTIQITGIINSDTLTINQQPVDTRSDFQPFGDRLECSAIKRWFCESHRH